MTDIQIAQQNNHLPITEVADKLNLPKELYESYGHYKAKIDLKVLNRKPSYPEAKLILVTAITPTKAGEGKSTTTIGLNDGLNALGHHSIACLRQPSMGPVFGMKGGATGGGYAQVVPMEDINLHFTGDLHAISAAHNLVSALIDNHLFQGNSLNIDSKNITWKRVIDMNDRALRSIVVGLEGKSNGVMRQDSFQITVASEIMAVLCLARDFADLKKRLAAIIFGYDTAGKMLSLADLKATGSVAVLLKDAIKPNLVQSLEGNPVFIHGGPFANIAHGCNSLIATKMALNLGEYVVTEAGFAADLGAEKFFDIKCRIGELKPAAVVLVTTIRALKLHGGARFDELTLSNTMALEHGFANLDKHIANIKMFGLNCVVAINIFSSDTEDELKLLERHCQLLDTPSARCEAWGKGAEGALALAKKVAEAAEEPSSFRMLYQEELPLQDKMKLIAKNIYGADDVNFSPSSLKNIELYEASGYGKLPVCVAKTAASLSDDPKLLGRPKHFTVTVSEVRLSAGAGFVVMLCGSIIDMPGLPKIPAALHIDIDEQGVISGLF